MFSIYKEHGGKKKTHLRPKRQVVSLGPSLSQLAVVPGLQVVVVVVVVAVELIFVFLLLSSLILLLLLLLVMLC